jgi:hypothetical protein
MHSWHIAFQDLFQSFELYSSKNIVKCPFSQILDTKGFQKESILQKSPIVMELSCIFHLYFFSLEKPISGKG